jgi:uncharacterized repeat protein (TIGR02543 family)
MDDLIDMFIIGVHFENWDWISNNFEAWRSRTYMPGVHGADRRWRFVVQDFDNAVFHGSNDMMTYFTAMKSPACVSSCRCTSSSVNQGITGGCFNHREGRMGTGGGFVDMGLPFSIFDLGRSEEAARLFRVLLQNPTFRQTFAARYSTYTGTAFHPARAENLIDEYAAFATLGGSPPAIGRHHVRWGLFHTNTGQGTGTPSIFSRDTLVANLPPATHYNNTRTRHGNTLAPWGTATTDASMTERAGAWNNAENPYRWPPHSLRSPRAGETMDDAPAGTPALRNQENVLKLRAAGPETTIPTGTGNAVGHNRNAIEHMRAYFARTTPSFAISGGTNPWGREHNPTSAELGGGTLGGVGASSRINWRITRGGTVQHDIGWLNIAGAHIREDLYKWGNLPFYGRADKSPTGFTPFQIGSFSARYLQNMPVTVTINDNPGHQFQTWELSGTVSLVSGVLTDRTITVRPSGTGGTVTASFSPNPNRYPIINQIFGQGTPDDNAVSHGFIELYNPWDTPVNLNNISLQVQNIGNNAPSNLAATPWHRYPLSGTIPPRHSFLIVSSNWYNTGAGGGHVPSLIINAHDMTIPIQISNRNVSVALVRGNLVLSPVITSAQQSNVIDLVGARNSDPPRDQVHNVWGPQAAWRITRQTAVRRVDFQNTRDNWADFIPIRYNELTFAERNFYRPRSLADGEWGSTEGTHRVTVEGGIQEYRAFPNPAPTGHQVSLQAGIPPIGMAFDRWTSDGADVRIFGATSPTEAFFVMPNRPVTVTANFAPRNITLPNSIIVNQVHGQGLEPASTGGNAISHGFIELYNPTNADVPLNGMSIQIMNDASGQWIRRNLPNDHVMEPGASFLIVSTIRANTNTNPANGHVPRYIIPNNQWDIAWPQVFGHNSLSVAIVNNTTTLSHPVSTAQWDNIIDFVSAVNDPPPDPLPEFLGEGPAFRMWRQGSARRIEYKNTHCNLSDFVDGGIDYRYPENYTNATADVDTHRNGITNIQLEMYRPRWSGDGGIDLPQGYITIYGRGRIGAGASPNPVNANQSVTVSAGYNDGFRFTHWTVESGNFTLTPAQSEQRVVTFTMPAAAVADGITLRAHWDERYSVTVSGSRAGDQSGAGTYRVGDRVVLFAGYRADGQFFNGWTGHNVNLLADRNAPITYFIMPDRDVAFTARWRELEGTAPFPMTLRAIANSTSPNLTHGAWRTGHRTQRTGANGWDGAGYYEPFNHANAAITVNGPGQFTLQLLNSRQNWPNAGADFRAILVTVEANGRVTSPDTLRSNNDQGQSTGANGRISVLPGQDGTVFVSYREGESQTITNPTAGIPAGHATQTLVPLYQLTVAGSFAAVPSTDGSITGQARFPDGQRVAVNAGVHNAGEVFTGWRVEPEGSVDFLDRFDPITSFYMPEHAVTVTASWGDAESTRPLLPTVMINQVYGQGEGNNNAVSHSFIELYNPTSSDVFLDGWSLQVWDQGQWNVLRLPAHTMEPSSSFLVVSTASAAASPRYTIQSWDMSWSQALSNRSFSVALVRQTTPLPTTFGIQDWQNLHDLVGVAATGSPAPSYVSPAGGSPTPAINNNNAVRRRNFQDTRVNSADFEQINYNTANAELIEVVRPRFSGDGSWLPPQPPGITSIQGGGPNASVTPVGQANAGQTVTINAGTRNGYQFSHWSIIEGIGVNLANRNSASTTFAMPNPRISVTVRANWTPVSGVLVRESRLAAPLSGQGDHAIGSTVVIAAGQWLDAVAGNRMFTHWEVVSGGVTLRNANSPITTFVMPEGSVEVRAHWRNAFGGSNAPAKSAPWNAAWSGNNTNRPEVMGVRHMQTNGSRFVNATANRGGIGGWHGGGAPGTTHNSNQYLGTNPAADIIFIEGIEPQGNWDNFRLTPMVRVQIANSTITVSGASRGPGDNATVFDGAPAAGGFSAETAGARFLQMQNRAGHECHAAILSRLHEQGPQIQYGVMWMPPGTATPDGWTVIMGQGITQDPTRTVVVNGSQANAAVRGAGEFTASTPTSTVVGINAGDPPAGQRFNGWTITPNTITITDASLPVASFVMPTTGTGNITVTASWATANPPPTVNWPTNLTAQFGQTLGSITPTSNVGGTPGSFSWEEGPDTPVGNVGTRLHRLTFTPTNTAQFAVVTQEVSVVVTPAAAPTLVFPTAATIMQGQALSEATLTGGVTGGATGNWAWVNGEMEINVTGSYQFPVTFTPTGASITSITWDTLDGFNAGPPITITRNVTVNVVPPPQPPELRGSVLINQVYGHGPTPNDNAVSHGFIELVNTTDSEIELSGLSLQIQNVASGSPANTNAVVWQVLDLNGRVIPPNRSFLIVSTANNTSVAGHVPRYTIPNNAWDMAWNVPFSNTNMSVALVEGTPPLTSSYPVTRFEPTLSELEIFGRIVDLVGTQRNPWPTDWAHNFLGTAPHLGLSQYQAARRHHNSSNVIRNNRDNATDFRTRDFRYPSGYVGQGLTNATVTSISNTGMTNAELQEFRPRHSNEVRWPELARRSLTVNAGAVAEVSLSPSGERVAGTTMTLTLTAPLGQRFSGAANSTIPVTGAASFNLVVDESQLSATGHFLMPATGTTLNVTPAFTIATPPDNIVISQLYGRAFPGEHAVNRGFIEIYNPTASAFNLENRSLQIQTISDGPDGVNNHVSDWEVIPFNDLLSATPAGNRMLQPRTSLLLVTSQSATGARYTIPAWDAVLPSHVTLNNRNFSVAIVNNTTQLSRIMPPSERAAVIDLVGVVNDIRPDSRDMVVNFLGTAPADNISNQQSIRRKWNESATTIQNFRRNNDDFDWIRYAEDGVDDQDLLEVRPRRRADGQWPAQRFSTTIAGNAVTQGCIVEIAPTGMRPAGTVRTVTVTAPLGRQFGTGAAVTVTGVPISAITYEANRTIATFTFTMPANNVTLTVNATLVTRPNPQGLVINQMYGRAMTDNQAVSRGFIEIYNSSAVNVDLRGLSLQVQNIADGPDGVTNQVFDWEVLNFAEVVPNERLTMPPRTSLLIVTEDSNENGARHIITNYDATMPIEFSNRNFSAAIVNGVAQLSNTITAGESPSVIDLVGAWNDRGTETRDRVVNFRGAPAWRISNQQSVRRIWINNVIQNNSNNSTDFITVRYAPVTDPDPGISDALLNLVRPRWSGNGEWTGPSLSTVTVNAGAGTTALSPSGAQFANTPMTLTVTAPEGQRFTANAGATVSATGAAGAFTLTVAANRLSATGTFFMPSASGAITVNAAYETIPGVVLARMVQTAANATAVNNTTPATSHFTGTAGGIFVNNFRLTAWDNNTQVLIGFAGTNRTPVVFNNGSWAPGSTRWNPASVVGIANAPSFQMELPNTTGYQELTLTARQKSTGSGPDAFFLAYRIGNTGNWERIAGSERTVLRTGNDTYAALNDPAAETYVNFALPSALNNQTQPVFLRVVFDGLGNLTAGNTSINDIEIRGISSTGTQQVTFNLAGGNIGGNTNNITITVPNGGNASSADPVRTGFVFDGWLAENGTPVNLSTLPITGTRTFTASWHRLGSLLNQTDGRVTTADATWIARNFINENFQNGVFDERTMRIADISGNGEVNLVDVVMLMQWLVGYDLAMLIEEANGL